MTKPASLNWHVYLLRCHDGSLYCGATTNIERRLKQHNEGKAAKYTRPRRPVKLIAKGPPMTMGEALSREAFIKRHPRQLKAKLVST